MSAAALPLLTNRSAFTDLFAISLLVWRLPASGAVSQKEVT